MKVGGPGCLIVGGGLAAQRCAETLRRRGFDEPIVLLCDEDRAPYDRPPLSKELLAGEKAEHELAFRPDAWYAENEVELILGRRATRLDAKGRAVELDDGRRLRYEALLIATGSTARELPILRGFENAYALRTLADARRLRGELRAGTRIALIGAGFIGLEVAATARKLGAEVTMIEAQPEPLSGVLGSVAGRWLADLHRSEGVRMRLGARLEAARGNGRVEELELAGGERIGCDTVVVGIGVAPAAGWLAGSGLDTDGVRTDSGGRSSLPGVFAAGDVARVFDPRVGRHVRAEHWDAAAREGMAAALAMVGDDPGAPIIPSFWSDQYGLRIQYVGYAGHADGVRLDGDPRERELSLAYTRDGRVVGGLAVGRPRAIAQLRREIEATFAIDPPHEQHDDNDKGANP